MFSGFLQSFSQPGRALFALAVCAATFPAAGAINVTYVGIDSETGGDYRTADYGNCFSVISQASPRTQIPEVEVGPNLYSWTIDELVLNDDGVLVPNPSYGQYDNRCSFDMTTIARDENVSNCLGKTPGILIPERAGIDSAVCITERGAPTMRPVYFDFRLHLLGEFSAYAWSFLEPDFDGVDETFEVIEWNDPDIYPVPIPGLPNRPASQFNACLTADQGGAPAVFRAGTFDNGEYEFDPLTGIVHIKSGGDATLAYYFLTAAIACREQEWTLTVWELDGNGDVIEATKQEISSFGIPARKLTNFEAGKYLVFTLDNIPGDGALVQLDTEGPGPGQELCEFGVNSVISGIFVSGTDACPIGSLGDRLWEDLNRNGVQDEGEPGIDDVAVRLYQDCGTIGETQIGVAQTSGGGLYQFTDLAAGNYCVEFDKPADFCSVGPVEFTLQGQGGDPAVDSDVDPSTGRTGDIVLSEGETDLTWDAGVFCPARLGDRVWLDANENGAQDGGEASVPGVEVNLYACDDLNTVIGTTTTDVNGLYHFDVDPGCYQVGFVEPDQTNFTVLSIPQGPGVGLPATDSDAHPTGAVGRPKGYTGEIEMESNELDETWDAGLVNVPDPLTPSIDIRKQAEGEDSRQVPYGGSVDFHIVVTNNGEVDLLNVVVTDPLLPQCDKDISQALIDAGGNPTGVFVVDAQFAYDCTDPMVTSSYRNVADVTGDPITGPPPVTDTDPSSVEVIPMTGGEGCTPGYWKQPHHFDSWTAPYVPDMLFSNVFEDAFPGMTLVEVLGQGGGGLKALGRHTVAALLNAASGGVSYDISTADNVIAGFNAVYPGSKGEYTDLKNEYEGFNEQGCPLN